MFGKMYKTLVIDFSKISIAVVCCVLSFFLYFSKDFRLDASSDSLLLESDKDLKYLREINERYGSKDYLVLTYTPISDFTNSETIINLQFLKSKIEKLEWVDSVVTIIDVPLFKNNDKPLMERLKNYKTLSHPEINKERGFKEILNSPIYKDYVISDDGKTSGIVVYLKKDK
jgi:predicted RND superfamily exporter protein